MKFSRLTKEQFEELNQEFSTFLATQAIDKAEWNKIKAEKPTTVAIFPTIASPPRMLAIRLVIELLYPNKSSQYLS